MLLDSKGARGSKFQAELDAYVYNLNNPQVNEQEARRFFAAIKTFKI